MSKFSFILTFVFSFFTFAGMTQLPGYMGKKVFIEGQLGVTSGVFGSIYSVDKTSRNLVTPIGRISANIVYARHRYFSLEADYYQFTDALGPLETFPGQPSLKYRANIFSYTVGFYNTKKKSGRTLAPLGRFHGSKFIFTRSYANPIKYADTEEKFDGVERAAFNVKHRTPDLSFIGFALSFGNRAILNDKFTFNYSMDLGFSLPISPRVVVVDERVLAYSESNIKRYNSVFVKLSIGMGILAF